MQQNKNPKRTDLLKENSVATASFPINHMLMLVACLLVTFICYIPALKNGWTHWDDQLYVTENYLTKKFSFSRLAEYFTTFQVGNYHPFTMLSLAFDYKLFGENAAAFHLHNVMLHLLNVWMVFLFTRMFSGKIMVAAITALFFGIHPAHVESVAWISERKDVLYAFYFLAGLTTYIKYIQSGHKKYYYITIPFFLFSLFSKGQAVVFPVVLLLIDFYLKRPFNKKLWMEKIPLFILSLIFGIVAMHAQQSANAYLAIEHYSFVNRICFASYSALDYLIKALLPLNLSAYYPYPAMIDNQYPWIFSVSPFVLLLLIAAVFYTLKFNRTVVFGIGFFILNILLVLQLVPVGGAMMADRYTYIAYIGLFFLIAKGTQFIFKSGWKKILTPRIPAALLLFFIIFFALKSYARNSIWKSDISLFSDMLKNYPAIPVANNNLGNAYMDEGKTDLAIKHFTAAIRVNTHYAEAYANRGNALVKKGMNDEAINDLTMAIHENSNEGKYYQIRGKVYRSKGAYQQALDDVLKSVSIGDKDKIIMSALYADLAEVYNEMKKYSASDSTYDLSLALNPDNLVALNNYAYNLSVRGEKLDLAATMAKKSLDASPGDGYAMDTYGWVLFKQKKYAEAESLLSKALKSTGENNGIILEHYGDVLYCLGDTVKAIQYWKKAKENNVESEFINEKIANKRIVN